MATLRHLRVLATAACLWAASVLSGCANLSVPAIDPSGQGLFSGTTTLASHEGLLHCPLWHKHQPVGTGVVPVAVQPPCAPPIDVMPVTPFVPVAPPQPLVAVPLARAIPVQPVACAPQQTVVPGPPPVGGPVCGPAQPPACDERGPELKVTPCRIVAPICSEVVLTAGICGPQGYFVTRQPLEWMLAQDGVGQIVAVGQESPHNVSYLLRRSPQKVATNYARAHTSTISQVIDRGTKNPTDDVFLEKGQSWISVTSPTEGTSHVVVWAPKEHNWERRKTTATIYWVDAVWQYPPPASARSSTSQPLTTTVMRSGGQPVAGWIVQYDVLEGPPAALSARGERSAKVITDAQGRATINLLPQSTESGITTVRVQIVRPATARGDLPEMIVGQGQTSVNWNSAGLSVRAIGTSAVQADGTVSYRVEVTNSGDLPTRDVKLTYTPPTGVTILNSTPAAQMFGERYEWRIGDLPPRTTGVVELNCRAAVAATLHSVFRASSGDGLTSEGRATTDVLANSLSVKMTGPEAVEVGREAKFLIDVTNTGTTPLANVTATDTFEPGLTHSQGERSPLVRSLGQPLAPGATDRFAVTFIVTEPGQQCHRLKVTADGGHTASARACVTGTQPAAPVMKPAKLNVRVTGPKTRKVGEVGEYFLEVSNAGTSAATNVSMDVQLGARLQLREATRGHVDDPRRNSTRWTLPQLAGGETIVRQLNCACLASDERATVQASVSSDQNRIAETALTTTQIAAAAAAPAPAPAPGPAPEPPAAGSLKVSVLDLADPIMLGGKTTYLLSVTNDRAVSDSAVAISIALSDGLKFVKLTGPTVAAATSPDGRKIDVTPVAELRAGESLDYRLEVEGAKAGRQKIAVSVKSTRTTAAVTGEQETTVNMP